MKKSLLFFKDSILTILKLKKSIQTSSSLAFLVVFVSFSISSYGQTTIDCEAGPVNTTYCYTDNDTTQFIFTNTGGFPLNVHFNAGEVEVNFDELIVLDTDGVTNLSETTPYGYDGNLAGLEFQSSGDTITVMIDSDSVISCQTNGFVEWDFDVWCQTCINPTVSYATDGDCTNGNDFNIFVMIEDMGSATTLNINDDQGSPQQQATTTGTITMGPYSFDTDVVITVSDADDLNCVVTSNSIGCLSGGPGSLFINAGDDITLSCNEACTDISANFLPTFESLTNNYTINEITYDPPFAFNGLANSINTNIDDAWSNIEDLPFDFCFFENIATQFQVGSNGVISFELEFDGYNGWSFDEDLPNNTNETLSEANVFTPGHDIDPSVNSSNEIAWEILGNYPNRVLVVSYYQVPYFSCNELLATHMAVFYEFSNVIEIYIQDKPTCESWNNGNAVVGIQNYQGNIAYVPPGRNTSDSPWTTTNEAWSFSPAGDPTYVFEWVDADGNFISNEPTINVCPEGGEETYTAKITYTNCNGDVVILTDDITVTLVADFTLLLPEDQVLCDEQSYEIIPETTGDINGATYLWSTGETTPTITVTTSGTYTLEMTRDDCTVEDSITVTFNERPIIDLGEDFETCFEEEIILDATPSNYDPADVTYQWSFNGTEIAGETNVTLTVSQIGEYSVVVSYQDCEGTDSIIISPANNIDIDLGNDFETCFEENVVLDASPSNYDPDAVTYQWSLDNVVLAGETNATLIVTQNGTYSVVVTFGECTSEDSININPRSDLEVTVNDDFMLCPNEPKIITSSTPETGVTYQWYVDGNLIAGETGSSIEIEIDAGLIGIQTYTVVITLGECTGSDSVDVTLYPIGNCVISQGISPNGSIGYNDILDLSFLDDRTGITKLQIFNRLGTLVYDKDHYTNQWRGQTTVGNDLPTGTYFYVIDLEGEDPVYGTQHSGWIYLNQEAN
ncbi:MAG: T9SS type B sorting domain-containing protein [Flavobacteriales bacterium]